MANPEIFDLAVVGGGPAGLSASIYAESEGVETDLVESARVVGGQMGTSSGIENFFGFPEGVTGEELACRGERQALKFTTDLQTNTRVHEIRPFEDGLEIVGKSPEGLTVVRGLAALITAGVEYRELNVPKVNEFLGRGVSYGSPNMKSKYDGQEIYIVGGANSAGQAAHFLSKKDCKVNVVVRGKTLQDKMSTYLCDRLDAAPNVEVHTETEIVAVDGDDELREATLSTRGDERTVSLNGLFIMIGAIPKVGWLPDEVTRDKHGFVITGSNVDEEARKAFIDVHGRAPLPHETTMPGVFAAGDVRSGTIKRVASAVGDGAVTISDIHQYLGIIGNKA